MQETASLSIASFGPATLENAKKVVPQYKTRSINEIGDIDGARTVNKFEKFSNKPTFQTTDIPGCVSKPLTHERNTRDNSLYIDDIEGTRRLVKDRMALTKRRVNPLNPEYVVPSFIPAEFAETKFVRDTLQNDDVEGSRSKPLYDKSMRDTFRVTDIEGAQANWRPRHRQAVHEAPARDTMKTQDVSSRNRYIDRASRSSHLLDPVYEINGIQIADDPRYTKPKEAKKFIPENHQLQTQDIPGATAGWREEETTRRQIRNTNFIQDIKGAQADTVKHSIQTKRETNPLLPVYQSLDPGEVLPPIIAPLLPASMITQPTLRPTKSTSADANNKASGIFNSKPNSAPTTHHTDYSTSYPLQSATQPFNFPMPTTTSYADKLATDTGFFQNTAGGDFGGASNSDPFGFGLDFSQPMNTFGLPPSGPTPAYQPPSFTLNFGGGNTTTTANNPFSLDFGGVGGQNSSRNGSGRAADKKNTWAAPPPPTNQNNKPYSSSPLVSGRSANSGTNRGPSAAEKRAQQERQSEIDSVRML